MQRHKFQHDGLTLSYLDAEGGGRVVVALHAHWMEGGTFAPLATALSPHWRVIALDQRGHGDSDHAKTYTRDDYQGDLESLFAHLGLKEPAVLLGNSLGGVNAYQFAARHPGRVRALVIEDIGAVIGDDTSFALAWGGISETREALVQRVGARFVPYLEPSFRQTPEGWRLAFDPRDTVASQNSLNGDHWKDWLASDCPALLIRGKDSRVTTQAHMEQMASRRANARLEVLDGGHVVHMDNPSGFTETVKKFLRQL
ncbi:MAG: alpha/beta fold hydrolase [Candidatus Sulfotelmatobacter sp.]